MKKILLITLLLFSAISFAQQTESEIGVAKNNSQLTTLTSVSASPNPFSIQTRIRFKSIKEQPIRFTVKNLLGKTVFLQKIDSKKGNNSINFERNNISKGMYIYTLQTETEVISKRLVIR